MKLRIFVFAFVVFFVFFSGSFVYAIEGEGGGPLNSNVCNGESLDLTAYDDFLNSLSDAFPINLLGWGMDILDSVSSIHPESPASIKLDVFSLEIYPFSILDSGVFDYIFAGIRYLLVALAIFGLVKHLMEAVL